jgi:hypothetical protein
MDVFSPVSAKWLQPSHTNGSGPASSPAHQDHLPNAPVGQALGAHLHCTAHCNGLGPHNLCEVASGTREARVAVVVLGDLIVPERTGSTAAVTVS